MTAPRVRPVADSAAADRWLHHLVARRTGAERTPPRTGAPLPQPDWDALMRAVVDGRITEALLDATVAGDLPATDEQLDDATDAHTTAMGIALVLERRLLAVHELLGAAGIELRVLKGPAVAHLDWDDPNQRDFGDIDVLVQTDQVAEALATLTDSGYHRPLPPLRPILDRVFAKGATLLEPTGYEIDVHRTLAPGPFGLAIDEPSLWAAAERFHIGGRALDALDAAARLVHTAAHLRLGSPEPRWSTVRDLLRQVDRVSAAGGAGRASGLGLTAVLAAALRRVVDHGYELPTSWADWLADVRLAAEDEARLADHDEAGGVYRVQALQALREVPWRWKGAVVASWLYPSRDHLAARHLDRRTYLRDRLLGGRER